MNVGERLANLRKQYGLTQNALAERAGVSQTHLRRIELGQADITVNHLELLCDAMSISLGEFFDEGNEENETSLAISKLSPKQKRLLTDFLQSL
ncbi:MAG: helix-turn-helix domain-containing protein [Eubacteriales bacterium]